MWQNLASCDFKVPSLSKGGHGALGWESNAGPPLANKQEQVMGGQDLAQEGITYFPTGLKFQQLICGSPSVGWWDTISRSVWLGNVMVKQAYNGFFTAGVSEPSLGS